MFRHLLPPPPLEIIPASVSVPFSKILCLSYVLDCFFRRSVLKNHPRQKIADFAVNTIKQPRFIGTICANSRCTALRRRVPRSARRRCACGPVPCDGLLPRPPRVRPSPPPPRRGPPNRAASARPSFHRRGRRRSTAPSGRRPAPDRNRRRRTVRGGSA